MRHVLILISGIGTEDYMLNDIKNNPAIESLLKKKYTEIIPFQYQEILDAFTSPGDVSRKYCDPIRFKLNGIRKGIILDKLRDLYDNIKLLNPGAKISLLAHSQGTQIALSLNRKVDTVILCGSPIGWVTPLLRFIVRNDISFFPNTPVPLQTVKLLNLYSKNDMVGHIPSISENKKWACKAKINDEYNTRTHHDFNEYLKWMFDHRHILVDYLEN